MEHINRTFYDGFEGEPEIQIIYRRGIEDLQMALKQFESINSGKLCSEAKEILASICEIINEAASNGYEVLIARE